MRAACLLLTLVCLFQTRSAPAAEGVLWEGDRMDARLVVPDLPGPAGQIVERTINGYFTEACGEVVPVVKDIQAGGLYIVAGDERNNPAIRALYERGLPRRQADLGSEGFSLRTFADGTRRFVVIEAATPAGLKYGGQELVFFRTAITARSAAVDYPLDVVRKPAFPYRGVYILPCWSAHDSIENWREVLKFHSELTINRNWFWLGGFPLMDKYGGEYQGTDLASVENVRGLVTLCRERAMKFLVGDGWFTWHHAKAAGDSMERGIQYYLDLMDLLPGTEGIYLEPVGEGADAKEDVWRRQAAGIRTLTERVWQKHPDAEFAVAIGRFNHPKYRALIHEIDDRRIYWWWCWGDPRRHGALSEHPLVLRWHTSVYMSEYHGSTEPPGPADQGLTGFATSYDPGQGYGNPWLGWARMGHDKPRNFHPRTLPYFSHQYWFRERCWDPGLTPEQFSARLARRLFDSDMPAESIACYLELADLCPKAVNADRDRLARLDEFVKARAETGTARNRDTFARMKQALWGIHREQAIAATRPK